MGRYALTQKEQLFGRFFNIYCLKLGICADPRGVVTLREARDLFDKWMGR